MFDSLTIWFVNSEIRHKGYSHLDIRVAGFDVILTITAGFAWWLWWCDRHPEAKESQRRRRDER